MKKMNSRWRAGNVRYPREVLAALDKYKERPGWHRGARVRRP